MTRGRRARSAWWCGSSSSKPPVFRLRSRGGAVGLRVGGGGCANGFGTVIAVTGPGAGPLGRGSWPRLGPVEGGGIAAGATALPPGAAVGDGLPPGDAGRRLAGYVGAQRLGPDAPRATLGPAGPGRAGWHGAGPGARDGRDPARAGGGGIPGGGLPAAPLCLARGGPVLARRRPRPVGQRPAQLRGRRARRRPGLSACPALARGRPRGDGRCPGGIQSEPAPPDAGSDAQHDGIMRGAGGAAGLWLA